MKKKEHEYLIPVVKQWIEFMKGYHLIHNTNNWQLISNRLDLGTLLKTAEQQQQQANDNLIAQYNQQATESIKNTIGVC